MFVLEFFFFFLKLKVDRVLDLFEFIKIIFFDEDDSDEMIFSDVLVVWIDINGVVEG